LLYSSHILAARLSDVSAPLYSAILKDIVAIYSPLSPDLGTGGHSLAIGYAYNLSPVIDYSNYYIAQWYKHIAQRFILKILA